MEGSQAGGAPSLPHLRGANENGGDLGLPAESTPSSAFTDWRAPPKSTPRARIDVAPVAVPGRANPSFAEEPPPYLPPDPKTVRLLYPPFQRGISGQGSVFYCPAPVLHAGTQPTGSPPGPYPFTIYNSAFFAEMPTEAVRSQGRPPRDYMVESILVMIFCCLLTGAMALVYSHETRSALSRGDVLQANAASQKARSLVCFSLCFGVFVSLSWVVYVIVKLYL